MHNNKNILIFTHFFYPAYKAGGPIRSIFNLFNLIGSHQKVEIICSDKDIDNTQIDVKKLNKGGVYYILNFSIFELITSIIRISTHNDILYLNSFFDLRSSILPVILLKLKLIQFDKLILAPRGEFSISALNKGRLKKAVFLKLSNAFGLYNHFHFHATSSQEFSDISTYFPKSSITLVENIPRPPKQKKEIKNNKLSGSLELCFVGRVNSHKNLLFALKTINNLNMDEKECVTLSILGDIEEGKYYRECLEYISTNKIRAEFLGTLPNEELVERLSAFDFMYLPSKSENFGHAIFEALSVGVPVIISDQTRFTNLKSIGCGYDLSLSKMNEFTEIISHLIYVDAVQYHELSLNSLAYSKKIVDNYKYLDEYLKLFNVGIDNV